MDQLPEKAPAREARAAPGCQELVVLLRKPGPPLRRGFAIIGQDCSAQRGGATNLEPTGCLDSNPETLLWVTFVTHLSVLRLLSQTLAFLSVLLDSSFTTFRVLCLCRDPHF